MFDWNLMSTIDRIKKCKIKLQKPQPFFGYILMNLNIRNAKGTYIEAAIPSMGIDPHGNLWYKEEWVKELSEDELTGVLCHEALHIALMHLVRCGSRNPQIFNIANDLVINSLIIKQGMTLPKEGCIPDRYHDKFEFDGVCIEKVSEKSSEEIYEELLKQMPKSQQAKVIKILIDGNAKGESDQELLDKLKGMDVHIYGDSKEGKEGKKKKGKGKEQSGGMNVSDVHKWRKIISEAASLAKNQGKLPAGMERLIEGILESRIPWTRVLYEFVVPQLPFDYSYCVDKDTLLNTNKKSILIKDIKKGDIVLASGKDKIIETIVEDKFTSIVKEKYTLYTDDGKRLICSGNHRILTDKGYIKAKDLNIDNIIYTMEE